MINRGSVLADYAGGMRWEEEEKSEVTLPINWGDFVLPAHTPIKGELQLRGLIISYHLAQGSNIM